MPKEKKGELVVLIGISGSGKSTYVRQHFDPKEVVCPDDIRRELTGNVSDQSVSWKAWKIAYSRINKRLETGQRVVLDALNVGFRDRRKMLALFPRAKHTAVVFTSDPEEAKRRVLSDLEGGVDRSNVSPEVIDKQALRFFAGYDDIVKQFDEVIMAGAKNEEVWRCVANSAGMVGGANTGTAGSAASVPKSDGTDHENQRDDLSSSGRKQCNQRTRT